jgi:hypothetical protein
VNCYKLFLFSLFCENKAASTRSNSYIKKKPNQFRKPFVLRSLCKHLALRRTYFHYREREKYTRMICSTVLQDVRCPSAILARRVHLCQSLQVIQIERTDSRSITYYAMIDLLCRIVGCQQLPQLAEQSILALVSRNRCHRPADQFPLTTPQQKRHFCNNNYPLTTNQPINHRLSIDRSVNQSTIDRSEDGRGRRALRRRSAAPCRAPPPLALDDIIVDIIIIIIIITSTTIITAVVARTVAARLGRAPIRSHRTADHCACDIDISGVSTNE